VPPPRVTNSWTADNSAIAGIARICTIRLSCQFGRVHGLIQVLSEPTMTLAGRRKHEPAKGGDLQRHAPGEVFAAYRPTREKLAGNQSDQQSDRLAPEPFRSELEHWRHRWHEHEVEYERDENNDAEWKFREGECR
jgi:hypothetical protein